MDQIIRPWKVSYSGKMSSDGFINTEEVGNSLVGSSKISVSLIHYISEAKVPHGRYKKKYQCITKPPVHGSFEVEQVITHAILTGAVTLENSDVIQYAFEAYFERVWEWVKVLLTRKDVNHEQEMERLRETSQHNLEMMNIAMNAMKEVSRTHAESLEKLSKFNADNLHDLAATNKNNAVTFVKPIGGTCNVITNNYFKYKNEPQRSLAFDEAEADVIRSKEEDVVGDLQEYNCLRVIGLDTETKNFHLSIEGMDGDMKGIISDPVLSEPHNPYTTALSNHSGLIIKAKPIYRNGEIVRLHVFDSDEKS